MPATPPSGVMTVLRRPPTWDEAKKQLGDASFMTKLIEYDKDKIDDGLLKKVAKFTVVGRRWGAGPDTGAGAGACVCRGGGVTFVWVPARWWWWRWQYYVALVSSLPHRVRRWRGSNTTVDALLRLLSLRQQHVCMLGAK